MNKVTIKRFIKSSIQISCDCFSVFVFDTSQLAAGLFIFFTIGSGLGTVGGLALYMYGGNFLITKMKTSNRTLNKIMGVIFIVAAMAQLYRILKA